MPRRRLTVNELMAAVRRLCPDAKCFRERCDGKNWFIVSDGTRQFAAAEKPADAWSAALNDLEADRR